MARKKKALYTYLSVKELEFVKIIVANKVAVESMVHEHIRNSDVASSELKKKQKVLGGV